MQTLAPASDGEKDSDAAYQVVRCGKLLQKHVHVGRVNCVSRYQAFAKAGGDTCDGTGICRFDYMLEDIRRASIGETPLFATGGFNERDTDDTDEP
ncbi:MAG: hypothetical protein ACOY3P_14325 [Planctomycetota bacterium]